MTDHRVDIRDFEELQSVIKNSMPDFVFHLAAQPLVKQSYIDPLETYETNIMGTGGVVERFYKQSTANKSFYRAWGEENSSPD